MYGDVITAVLEDRAHFPAYTLHNSFGVENHVEGFDPHPLSGENPRVLGSRGDVSLRE